MIKINNKFKNLIPDLLPEELKLLKENIEKEGIREPIIIWNDFIVDGHNRFQISKELKIDFKTKEKKFESEDEVCLWIINNQLGRRNISHYDRTRLVLKSQEILESVSKEKQKTHTKQGYQKSDKAVHVLKELGKKADVSHDTVHKVKIIEKFATPQQKERLSKQKDSINYVYNEVKKELNKSKPEQVINLPKNKFSIIYADPPWRYQFSETNQRAIETKYNSMSLEQIKKMKIPSEENSVLFLWATSPKLKEALEVMESWGFEYKTHAIWDKEIIGMGYWFRGQHELLLVGTKGKVKTPKEADRISSVIKIKRTKHSEKPEYFYELIEKLFPDSNYLELFARKKRNKWISWGNEV